MDNAVSSETGAAPENAGQSQTVQIVRGGVDHVQGEIVTLEQGGANSVSAGQMTVRQGGVVKATTQSLEMLQGSVLLAQAEKAHLTASEAGVLLARGEVKMDQSGAQVLLANGPVSMNQGGALVMVAREVKADKSGVAFLFAQKVEGNVTTLFGPRESILFGIVAGLVTGVVLLVSGKVKRNRRKS